MFQLRPSLINQLYQKAASGNMQHLLASAMVQGNKLLSDIYTNTNRNYCRGHHISSQHAEQRTMLSYFNDDIVYRKDRGWCFQGKRHKKGAEG